LKFHFVLARENNWAEVKLHSRGGVTVIETIIILVLCVLLPCILGCCDWTACAFITVRVARTNLFKTTKGV
jgi:hypothetical protein